MSPQAGWYAAPGEPGMTRFWDGQRWTEHRQPLPSTGPLGAPALDLLSKVTTAQQYLGSEPVRATGIAVRMIVVGVAVLLFSEFVTRTMHWDDGRVAQSSATTLLAAVLPAAGLLSLVGGIGTFVWRVLPVGASVRRFAARRFRRDQIEGPR